MTVKLKSEKHLVFRSLEGGCTGSSESTLIKMPHCWKSHVAAHIVIIPSVCVCVCRCVSVCVRVGGVCGCGCTMFAAWERADLLALVCGV